MKYNIIYADPPWQYNFSAKLDNKKIHGCAEQHYNTLSLDELKLLPIKQMADINCALLLWVTFPKLQEGLELLKSWGFIYKTVAFTWVKIGNNGKPRKLLGFYTRSNAEICLLGIKGSMHRIDTGVSQVIFSKLQHHSKKPDETRIRIVKLFGDLPRIELFSRDIFDGWDNFGNELADTKQKYII